MNYKIIDLFAGIGGFYQGFKNQGYECVMSSEYNSYAQETYTNNYGHVPLGDITKINPADVPTCDVITAGFPCQPFSICGKKMGFEDTRGTLFFYICRIIKEKKPQVVLLENVKFLLHHDSGRTINVILETLNDLGYNVSHSLLNALDYGVPQNRERVIIIATLKNKFDFSKLATSPRKSVIEDILEDDNSEMEYLEEKEYTLIENPVKQSKSGLKFIGYRNKSIRINGVRENTQHLSRVHKQPNRIYSIEGTHPTLPSQESSGRFFIYNPKSNKVRKLTIRECYRLMGFSDGFVIHKSKSEAYKQIGNSVCVPMVEALAKEIKNQILEVTSVKSQRSFIQVLPRQERLFEYI